MVIAYLRVSTTHQHLENQRDEITRYAQRKEIRIDRWITDTVSGKTDRRKRNLGKTLTRLKKGDALIITEISRLSRSLHEIMIIMKHCVDNNVVIYSTKDGYTFDDSINSKVLGFAFGLAAEIEHKLISQRTREALAFKKEQGVILGRKKGSGEKIRILYQHKETIMRELSGAKTPGEICRKFGVSYMTFYRFRNQNPDVAELMNLRPSSPYATNTSGAPVG